MFLTENEMSYQKIIYCCVPVRWDIWQTTLDPGSDKTRVQGFFGAINRWTKPYTYGRASKPLKIKKCNLHRWAQKYGPTIGPVLLRQGEPGTSQYVHVDKSHYWATQLSTKQSGHILITLLPFYNSGQHFHFFYPRPTCPPNSLPGQPLHHW